MKIPCDAIYCLIFSINNFLRRILVMTGIYLITNKVNGKKYIGQSVDIERRYKEHLRSGQPNIYSHKNERDIKTPIHLAMQKYGISNFSLTILEQCSKEELDEKEKFWINKYHSNDKKYGYNLTTGGQKNIALKGEKHSQSKLTQKEVDNIKKLLKNTNMNLNEILVLYPFISKSTLSMINQGKTWYDENDTYPLRQLETSHKGSSNGRAKFTEAQVMEIRTLYSKGVRPIELIQKYSKNASEAAVSSIIYGKSFKYLPVWNNRIKQWIEPCIDYSQSLK